MKKIYWIPLATLVAIILINFFPFRMVTYLFKEDYTYANYNGEYICSEYFGKGSSYAGCQRKFKTFSERHPDEKDKTMYRIFTIKPWRFWQWYEYFGKDKKRFSLPYRSPEKINETRLEEGLPAWK
ncbi:hypothetical protein LLH06_10970 [Mucilaginibacter daejeonensis]|uniref:hypothetical protein n=1 Tax=Mucilaginibacter daejeonensis TaxID=398049 RepID=UPI001D177198|nr:hypothetical protein [Mucilaginibacter daejeonensis]UEG51494.1 hypothetical protein LLH06_10970 [Mucilaginibacter daejeonensis]